jgi:multicomponent Na+:H+ antiporter subunit D
MIISFPILIPFLTAVLLLFLKQSPRIQKIVGVIGTVIQFVISIYLLILTQRNGIQVMYIGGWEAPFGIPLVIDLFSAIMLVVSGIIGACIAVYAITGIDNQRKSFGFYFFLHTLLMGVNGAFITGDVFNLYVWFEVMLMASFALLALGNEKQQLEGSIKYITINLLSSFFFLVGIALLYSKTGTLNMADLARMFNSETTSINTTTIAMLFFIAFGIKAALFPFFFWLPASYHTPPVTITAFFAGLITKVAVYAMVRFFTLFLIQERVFWHPLMLVVAGFTMLIGVLAAASQMEIRRILSFHIISQIGYMIMGLGLFTTLSIAGAIYFIVHNIFAKTNAFLVGGLINKLQNSYYLKKTGGLFNAKPGLAFLFFIPGMALAGIPPLSGFFGKFILIKASFDTQHYVIGATSLVVSLITLYSMLKIWNYSFWKEKTDNVGDKSNMMKLTFTEILPSVVLALLSVAMGIGAGYMFDLCLDAAKQLIDSTGYIQKVIGEN